MGSETLDKPVQFGFNEFALEPVYQELNVRGIKPSLETAYKENPKGVYVLDYSCGTGTGLQIVHDYAGSVNKLSGFLLGLDPDPVSIGVAQDRFEDADGVSVGFMLGKSDVLEASHQYNNFFNLALFLNAIHEFPNEETQVRALRAIAGSLQTGGRLVLNSTFIKEAYPEGSAFIWGKWKAYAQRQLKGSRVKTPTSFQIHPIEHYAELIRRAGLEVESITYDKVAMPESALIAISKYKPFIDGVFSDHVPEAGQVYTLVDKYLALVAAVEKLKAEHLNGKDGAQPFSIPRNWATVIAQKR